MSGPELPGWDRLRHGGLLLDPQRLGEVATSVPAPLDGFHERELRRRVTAALEDRADRPAFVSFVLGEICGFTEGTGTWRRGSQVPAAWGRGTVTGETARPRQLWLGPRGGVLPVFFDTEKRIGVGRGRRVISHALQWLRAGDEKLAIVTNGEQWRLVFAGLDFDAWCEWDLGLWLEEGEISPQVTALRTLIQPALWIPPEEGAPGRLLQAILDSRKGQAELSRVLGERVREAVEILIRSHGDALDAHCADVDPADVYRAAVRVVMRLVVVLFAESRELLPRDNALYHAGYGITGLLEELEKTAARGGNRLARSWSAWPRLLALFRLVHEGSHHPDLPVPAYGGELFAPGDPDSPEGASRCLALFERACFDGEVLPDRDVHHILERITRTRVRIRQGRARTWVPAPVDFSDLSSEYIGILYEGLLDFELKKAPDGDPVIFLAVGNQPGLPLSRLEEMDDRALASLLAKMKDTSSGADDVGEDGAEGAEEAASEPDEVRDEDDAEGEAPEEHEETGDTGTVEDDRHATRTRAEVWARRAVVAGKLVRKPRGKPTPEKRLAHEEAISRKARQLVIRVVLPGERYLVRWGGTRKGSGSFYTRPGLAVPTVQRALRPLAFDPPAGAGGGPDPDAPASRWTPKLPEAILALAVCDPACGSGTFPVAALRFLTDALYAALHHHGRIGAGGERAVVRLLEGGGEAGAGERLGEELIPCPPEDERFEPRLRAVLRRHVVERCIYGVDLDPLAVELCRLALWIETMDRTLPFSFLDHKVRCGNALVGAWFDRFRHYPAMAWKNREGGDKSHSNGVHYAQHARTKTIKAFVKEHLQPDLRHFLAGRTLFSGDLLEQASAAHDEALGVLARLHALPVHDAAERARIYHDELLDSRTWRSLKAAMDRWCACWFWPAEAIEHAPLPSTFADPPPATRAVAEGLAARLRFFHWELEFPDVFREAGSGFDAILGNPPWDIAKPNSKEFFSSIDPLYRAYGKQEALRRQTEYFADEATERAWLEYNAELRAQSSFVAHAASPFGDPEENESSQGRFAVARGKENAALHARWREARARASGFADRAHPFRHQGAADLNLYKLFLEQAHALLRPGGRLGFVVPSGLYSDHGTGALRRLFLERCRFEWLFGFENRDGIFPIDSRFKFNPVVVEKGGCTEAIHTAFMRRRLEDWERAGEIAIPYALAQVERFSPRSRALLEIGSARDLEILETIYADSVLLGDDGPDGWGIRYATEFHMTNDSRLFPPRPRWEAQGYHPDEYSRWLKGDWRPIGELRAELGVDPARPAPAEIELEDWLFDTSADPVRRAAEARLVHGHLLMPGDIARTEWDLRCAQAPYDTLPVPRADLPAGIVLSRDGNAWIHEDRVEDVALPLYVGKMIYLNDWAAAPVGRDAPGRLDLNPDFLLAARDIRHDPRAGARVVFRDIARTTDMRTFIAAFVPGMFPCGNKAPLLNVVHGPTTRPLVLTTLAASLAFDWAARIRLSSTSLNWHIVESLALPRHQFTSARISAYAAVLNLTGWQFSAQWLQLEGAVNAPRAWSPTPRERVRLRALLDAVAAATFGLSGPDLEHILRECDHPRGQLRELGSKGFWRVDKEQDPELRHTVLTLVAFRDLEVAIAAAGGDRERGIEAFLAQNHGEGWMLPETLRLADYDLGHDERAKEHQPVASRLGPRFFDWQLTQTPEESWRECHLHARNLLGEAGYRDLLSRIAEKPRGEPLVRATDSPPPSYIRDRQGSLFE